MGLAIRPALADDLETLLEIQREAAVAAFGHIFPQDSYPFPSDEIREVWRQTLADPDIETYIAEVEGEPAGSLSVGGEFLRTLYVLPSRQGSGVGSALHDLALERLGARGILEAKLWTLEENWDARRFYEKRGWTLTDETRVVPFPPQPLDVQYAKDL
ncbi:MAG TPA: GNAT family N-acetyltransferase [Gaiellaceae bacterium]